MGSKEEHNMQINMEWVQWKNIICKSEWSGFKGRTSHANQQGEGSNEKCNMQISMEWVQMKNIVCKSAWSGCKGRTSYAKPHECFKGRTSYANQHVVGSKEEHNMQISRERVQMKNIICKSAWSGFK